MTHRTKNNFTQQTLRRDGLIEYLVTAPSGDVVYRRATNQADRLRMYIHEGDRAIKQWKETI